MALIVILAQGYSIDWLIFSPTKQKTIFNSKLTIEGFISTSRACKKSIAKQLACLFQPKRLRSPKIYTRTLVCENEHLLVI